MSLYNKSIESEANKMTKIKINGLNERQYRNKYLKLCGKYDKIDQSHITMSWVNGLYYGYLQVK